MRRAAIVIGLVIAFTATTPALAKFPPFELTADVVDMTVTLTARFDEPDVVQWDVAEDLSTVVGVYLAEELDDDGWPSRESFQNVLRPRFSRTAPGLYEATLELPRSGTWVALPFGEVRRDAALRDLYDTATFSVGDGTLVRPAIVGISLAGLVGWVLTAAFRMLPVTARSAR